MAKYTPGPWKVEEARHGFVISAKDGLYDVAVVRTFGNEDNKANANLIAAAPALLEALKELLQDSHDRMTEVPAELYHTCFGAIAKAEGRDA